MPYIVVNKCSRQVIRAMRCSWRAKSPRVEDGELLNGLARLFANKGMNEINLAAFVHVDLANMLVHCRCILVLARVGQRRLVGE